jgi:hypothetical protein
MLISLHSLRLAPLAMSSTDGSPRLLYARHLFFRGGAVRPLPPLMCPLGVLSSCGCLHQAYGALLAPLRSRRGAFEGGKRVCVVETKSSGEKRTWGGGGG